jgi:hypothetical protein
LQGLHFAFCKQHTQQHLLSVELLRGWLADGNLLMMFRQQMCDVT